MSSIFDRGLLATRFQLQEARAAGFRVLVSCEDVGCGRVGRGGCGHGRSVENVGGSCDGVGGSVDGDGVGCACDRECRVRHGFASDRGRVNGVGRRRYGERLSGSGHRGGGSRELVADGRRGLRVRRRHGSSYAFDGVLERNRCEAGARR